MTKVLVTAVAFGKNNPELKQTLEEAVDEVVYSPHQRPLTEEELLPLIRDVDGFIAGVDEVTSRVIQNAPDLQVISRYGVGVDRVDITAATEQGIVVTNTPGVNADAVAEMTILLMLALGRDLCHANAATKAGEWPTLLGVGLKGKTVGLIGVGAVGKSTARRLGAFDCRILGNDRSATPEEVADLNLELADLEKLLADSDYVSLHLTSSKETRHFVDRKFIKDMKEGAFLINTARGELIDEQAVLQGLRDSKLRGVGLDCYQEEPVSADNPLVSHPRVIATPHTASHTTEAVNAMGSTALQECLSVLNGEWPNHAVNPWVHDQTDLQ